TSRALMTPFVSVNASSAARGSVSRARRAMGRGDRARAMPRARTDVRRFGVALVLVTFATFSLGPLATLGSLAALGSFRARVVFAPAFTLADSRVVFIFEVVPSQRAARKMGTAGNSFQRF